MEKRVSIALLWNMYHHAMVPQGVLDLLQGQAKKLLEIASLEAWEASSYGELVRFCDQATFLSVRPLLEFYAISRSDATRFEQQQETLRKQWDESVTLRKRGVKIHCCIMGVERLRSHAPMIDEGLGELFDSSHNFWTHGMTTDNAAMVQNAKYRNPLFGGPNSWLRLHPSTDPMIGFHLATAYADLAQNSPLAPMVSDAVFGPNPGATLSAAFAQFQAWIQLFRNFRSRWTIRFVTADALAFSHVLQHYRSESADETANWYRDNMTWTPLVLDAKDYRTHAAPKWFDFIYAPNLIDGSGSLNVLVATAPLLRPRTTSMLRTESLMPPCENFFFSGVSVLLGHVPSVAFFLGLMPVDYWTDASATWTYDNQRVRAAFVDKTEMLRGATRSIALWKPTPDRSMFRCEAESVAEFLSNLSFSMFEEESWHYINGPNHPSQGPHMPLRALYTRASLASIFKTVKNARIVSWPELIDQMLYCITNDTSLGPGFNNTLNLLGQCHVWGVLDAPPETYWDEDCFVQKLNESPMGGWSQVPSIICLTVVVPRTKIDDLKETLTSMIAVGCYVSVKGDGEGSSFTDVQLGFGQVTALGTRYSEDFSLHIAEDDDGLDGESPFIVSAVVPLVALFSPCEDDPEVRVALRAEWTRLASRLGPGLALHESKLMNDDVFLTKYRPNMAGHMSVLPRAQVPAWAQPPPLSRKWHFSPRELVLMRPGPDFSCRIQPTFDALRVKVNALVLTVEFPPEDLEVNAKTGADVAVATERPFALGFYLGPGTSKNAVEVPFPLAVNLMKCERIGDDKAWCYQCTAITQTPAQLTDDSFMVFPMRWEGER